MREGEVCAGGGGGGRGEGGSTKHHNTYADFRTYVHLQTKTTSCRSFVTKHQHYIFHQTETALHLSFCPAPTLHRSSYTTLQYTYHPTRHPHYTYHLTLHNTKHPSCCRPPHYTYHPSLPYHTYDLALCHNTPTILPARTSTSTPTQTTTLTPIVTTCTCTILITLPDLRSPSIILPTLLCTYHHT